MKKYIKSIKIDTDSNNKASNEKGYIAPIKSFIDLSFNDLLKNIKEAKTLAETISFIISFISIKIFSLFKFLLLILKDLLRDLIDMNKKLLDCIKTIPRGKIIIVFIGIIIIITIIAINLYDLVCQYFASFFAFIIVFIVSYLIIILLVSLVCAYLKKKDVSVSNIMRQSILPFLSVALFIFFVWANVSSLFQIFKVDISLSYIFSRYIYKFGDKYICNKALLNVKERLLFTGSDILEKRRLNKKILYVSLKCLDIKKLSDWYYKIIYKGIIWYRRNRNMAYAPFKREYIGYIFYKIYGTWWKMVFFSDFYKCSNGKILKTILDDCYNKNNEK